jgi:hypothetical protein
MNTQVFCFSHRPRPPNAHITLNGQNIPFINGAKYLSVIFRPSEHLLESTPYSKVSL